MKLAINRAALKSALSTVSRAVSSKTHLPVLSNVLIDARQDGRLTLACTNLEISIQTHAKAEVDVPGGVTVPASLLGSLLSSWGAETLSAELDEETQTLKVDAGNANAEIKGICASEFPKLPNIDDEKLDSIALDPGELHESLRHVAFAASPKPEMRPVLASVFFRVEADELVLAAADGYRLSVDRIPADPSWSDTPLANGLLIPAPALKELAKLLPGDGEHVRLYFTRAGYDGAEVAQATFALYNEGGEVQTLLTTQLIDGNFPDYTQIIPKARMLTVTVDSSALKSAVSGVSIFASRGGNTMTSWYIHENTLLVRGVSAEMGEQVSRVSVKTDGMMQVATVSGDKQHPDLGVLPMDGKCLGKFNVNGSMMSDVLSVAQGEIEMGLNQPSSPIMLLEEARPDFTHVIMPMHSGSG